MAQAAVPSAISGMLSCHCGSSQKTQPKPPHSVSSSAMPSAAASACRRKPTSISRSPAKPAPRSRTWLRQKRVCRAALRSASRLARPIVSLFARSVARRTEPISASWSRSPHLKIRRLICSSKDRRPIGHCRCLNRRARQLMTRLECDDSPLTWTVCPQARVAKGATLTFTAVSPDRRHRGRSPSRLIRPAR